MKTTSAGFCWDNGKIELNKLILDRIHPCFTREILCHEFSHHLMNSYRSPNHTPHGKEWKFFADLIGAFPSAYHRYPISPVISDNLKDFFPYECGNRIRWFDREEHSKHKGTFRSTKIWRYTERRQEGLRIQLERDRHDQKLVVSRMLDRITNRPLTFWRHYEFLHGSADNDSIHRLVGKL